MPVTVASTLATSRKYLASVTRAAQLPAAVDGYVRELHKARWPAPQWRAIVANTPWLAVGVTRPAGSLPPPPVLATTPSALGFLPRPQCATDYRMSRQSRDMGVP